MLRISSNICGKTPFLTVSFTKATPHGEKLSSFSNFCRVFKGTFSWVHPKSKISDLKQNEIHEKIENHIEDSQLV